MREQIGLPFCKDCKGSNPTDFSKFITKQINYNSFQESNSHIFNFYLRPIPIRPPNGILFIVFIISFI